MSLHLLSIGEKAPELVNAVIEIPVGSHNKYELDEHTGVVKLDRVLYSPMYYPVEYGYIPATRSEDGDHLDIMVLGDHPTFPGCVCEARPIGMLRMIDSGEVDNKILAVAKANPRFNHITSIDGVSPHVLKEIVHFFETYKDLQGKVVTTDGWHGVDVAYEEIKKAQAVFAAE